MTNLFKSVALVGRTIEPLENLQNSHDYLDDLESVVWILVYFVVCYDGPGRAMKQAIKLLGWQSSTDAGFHSKTSAYVVFAGGNIEGVGIILFSLHNYWKPYRTHIFKLLVDLFTILDPLVYHKKLNRLWHEAFPEGGRRDQELEAVSGKVFDASVEAFEAAVGGVGEVYTGLRHQETIARE